MAEAARRAAGRIDARTLLRALREARGVSQDGWAALLGYGTTTVRRWEAGTAAPSAAAEAAISAVCAERGLFRHYDAGPLRGLTLTGELLRDVLAEARLAASAGGDARPGVMRDASPSPGERAAEADEQALPPGNLPAAVTSFVGRVAALAEVRRWLLTPLGAGGTRLLTLTGAGGCGKTRLALEVAAGLRAEVGEGRTRYPDGVWLVELATLPAERAADAVQDDAGEESEPRRTALSLVGGDLVGRTVAATLGVREQAGRTALAALLEHLRERRLLLLLDNCEHVVASSAALTEAVLRGCPGVQVLATSREVLRAVGEAVFRVPSLDLPDAAAGGTAGLQTEALLANEAVRLFVERAAAASNGWTVTAAEAGAVAQICRRLDGIPLALELAAARVRSFSVAQIAARLNDRFRLLVGGERTLARHETLRACIDWSHDLLTAEEQILFRRLAVFAGGFDLDAAEAVCGGEGLDPDAILNVLVQLVEKSMVVAEQRDGERYRLLETIREYAHECLASEGRAERDNVPARHAHWYARFAEQARPHLAGAEQARWVRRVELEIDNIRAAARWALAHDEGELGIRAVEPINRFWEFRGFTVEGRTWLAQFLARGSRIPAPVRAAALYASANFASDQGDTAAALHDAEAALELYREAGNTDGTLRALVTLGSTRGRRGDHAGSRAVYEEALPMVLATGDRVRWAGLSINLAHAMMVTGDAPAAERLYREVIPALRELGNRNNLAIGLLNIGNLLMEQARTDEARPYLEEALAIGRAIGHTFLVATCLRNVAEIAYREGDPETAHVHYRECVALRREIGDRIGVAVILLTLAHVDRQRGDSEAAAAGIAEVSDLAAQIGLPAVSAALLLEWGAIALARAQPRRAARLFGAADATGDASDVFGATDDYAAQRARAREILGDAAFDAAHAEGGRLTFEEALTLATEPGDAEPPSDAAAGTGGEPGGAPAPALPDGLSAREAEVLALLAAGLTTREMADRLVVSPRTVEHHLKGIYRKIGARNRAEATAYALRRGLTTLPDTTDP